MDEDRIAELADHAKQCADFYADKPGLVSHHTTIDLYQTIALLCHLLLGRPIPGSAGEALASDDPVF